MRMSSSTPYHVVTSYHITIPMYVYIIYLPILIHFLYTVHCKVHVCAVITYCCIVGRGHILLTIGHSGHLYTYVYTVFICIDGHALLHTG